MAEEDPFKSFVLGETLVGTFDILGATALYAENDAEKCRSMTSFIVNTMSDAIKGTTTELKNHYNELSDKGSRLERLIGNTSSYAYADTVVLICDVSNFNEIMLRFACEYFLVLAIEFTQKMFTAGIPIRGCLSKGITARCARENMVVVSGKAYVETLKTADALEFSGTVLADEFYKVVEEGCKIIDYPPMEYLLQLPCVVKDKDRKFVTKKLWCLDWLTDTDFLPGSSDIRQLIFESFAGHGKQVCGTVLDKVNNTETIIRLMIAHRSERLKR